MALNHRFKGFLAGTALLVLIAAAAFGVDYYRHRFVRSHADLLALLPSGDETKFFADVELLRKAGMLQLLAGANRQRDYDYRSFVRETGFDYAADLNILVGTSQGQHLFFLLQGRFDWERLHQYASAHGGTCAGDLCQVPNARTHRWLGFLAVQPDVLALALDSDPKAVSQLKPSGRKLSMTLSPQPVWVSVSESLLKNPVDLPSPLRTFAGSLQAAHPVILSLDAAAEGTGSAFKLQLDAACDTETAAETIRSQWEIQTRMLKLELAREHHQPSPSDLTGLLTAGGFQVVNQHFIGVWPVRTELLQALQ